MLYSLDKMAENDHLISNEFNVISKDEIEQSCLRIDMQDASTKELVMMRPEPPFLP